MTTAEVTRRLKKNVKEARVECPVGSQKFLVPRHAQRDLITESKVEEVLRAEYDAKDNSNTSENAIRIVQKATQLFTILIYVEKPQEILALLDEGITDKDLPFRRKIHDNMTGEQDSEWMLEIFSETHSTHPIKTLDAWSKSDREKFSKAQKLIAAPFFELGSHQSLDDNVTLPFLRPRFNEKASERRGGGYSEILLRKPYPSQHNFWKSSEVNAGFPLHHVRSIQLNRNP